jgi:YD repeat-containing protein
MGYREDGSVRDRTVTVLDASGATLSTTAHHDDVDALGRTSGTTLNGAPLATYTYDGFDRPSAAAFTNGDSVALAYDGFTRDWVGVSTTRAGGAWSGTAVAQFKHDTRGFIGQELLGVGPGTVRRTYGYSAQGFLSTSTDGAP